MLNAFWIDGGAQANIVRRGGRLQIRVSAGRRLRDPLHDSSDIRSILRGSALLRTVVTGRPSADPDDALELVQQNLAALRSRFPALTQENAKNPT